VDTEGICLDQAWVQALAQWPTPSSTSALKIFMGGINFYRNFVFHFSHIALPLHQLSNNTNNFV
jgi:hypothetical protein